MAAHKHIDRVCAAAVAAAILMALLLPAGAVQAGGVEMEYAGRLFDTTRVHTIDIQIDDWEAFLSTCQSEEYAVCDVVIDGERFSAAGIRGKGNTSLTNVASMDSDLYSFKLEFDQYDDTLSYYGLDKLSLSNLIQDNTMMKDYLVYQMMGQFGAAAPLCSYVYITVNGEDWGLYLAVEAVEESFLLRNYGSEYGELYKPDSMAMGGGRGNEQAFDVSELEDMTAGEAVPGGFDPGQMGGMSMGSSDVKLQYIDDDPESYATIFDSAKTDVADADKARLIASLKTLSEGTAVENVVDVEAVMKYFVVHNFVVNGDSYTGSMIHNYYLYEQDGKLAMLPWDYNLAFGTFQGGDASSAVNDDIDAPLSVGGNDRPMIDWIFGNETYTELYHGYFGEFLETVDIAGIIEQARELIAPYVERDPTKFCTYEEFERGVQTLEQFCELRSESAAQQLAGEAGEVDASGITLSDMGTMGNGMGGGRMNAGQAAQVQTMPAAPDTAQSETETAGAEASRFGGRGMDRGQMPGMSTAGTVSGDTGSVIYLAVSLVFLIAGLVFARRFRR